jgi:hypothetical protein
MTIEAYWQERPADPRAGLSPLALRSHVTIFLVPPLLSYYHCFLAILSLMPLFGLVGKGVGESDPCIDLCSVCLHVALGKYFTTNS